MVHIIQDDCSGSASPEMLEEAQSLLPSSWEDAQAILHEAYAAYNN